MLATQSRLVQKGNDLVHRLERPKRWAGSSWIQGCKQHHDWVYLSRLCLPALVGFMLWQALAAPACILSSQLLWRGGIPDDSAAVGIGGTGKGRWGHGHSKLTSGGMFWANLVPCGLLPRNWAPLICPSRWSRSAFWKKLRSRSRF